MGVLIQIPHDATIESNTGEGDTSSRIYSNGLVVAGVGVGQIATVKSNVHAEPRGTFSISRVDMPKPRPGRWGHIKWEPAIIWSADSLPLGTTSGDLLFIE